MASLPLSYKSKYYVKVDEGLQWGFKFSRTSYMRLVSFLADAKQVDKF